ncbi:MAG: eukaryotic-like serine/threonine-protein kinase [Actinomycetota bacterium]|nr:eukaryotic-like serine/threonine-protein kinase [Actinomycetota bacterium]
MDTTVRDPLVGRVLDGRYHVASRLARGGMATVYEAVDSRLDRTVALKVMHANLAQDEEFVSRFIREAKSAARLSHPNVVAVYDQGADDGHVFLAMEHVPGRTLRDLLRLRGRLSPRQALEVLEPMLAALGAAHQAGIVHRDVKPENVLLSDDGRVKVADFGLARATSSLTSHTNSGVLLGTVAYLSPEQVERGIADPRSDVYAAGIVLYEMLTGDKPHDGETAIQVAYRHVHDDVPPPSHLVAGLPAELDALVARATNRNPDGRPPDARRFLTEVVSARRSLSDDELDTESPSLAALSAPSDETVVVSRDGTPPLGVSRSRPARALEPGGAPRARRRRRGPVALLLVLALSAALSFGAWWFAAGPGSYVDAPSLLGLTRSQAHDKAARQGFGVRVVDSGFSETVAAGRVLHTRPDPGGQVKQHATIGLVLSRGPERYDVPDLVNQTADAARLALTKTHLAVGHPTSDYSDTVAEGSVISTDPPAGTSVKRDTAVVLVLSKGVEPVAVPDVTGKGLADARAALSEAGLRARVADERFDDKVARGDIIRQTPKDGTAAKNSVVQLVVSKGPPLVQVPDVRGRSIAEATRILQSAGFRVRAVGFGSGTVRGQTPNGGLAPKGSTVSLVYI